MCKEWLFVSFSCCPKIALSEQDPLSRKEAALTQALNENEVCAMLRKGGLGIVTDWLSDAFK